MSSVRRARTEARPLFQTGWFVESLLTQTLIIHIIRTAKIPFIESRASPALIADVADHLRRRDRLAIHLGRRLPRLCPVAAALLAGGDRDHRLLRGADPYGEDMVCAAMGNVRGGERPAVFRATMGGTLVPYATNEDLPDSVTRHLPPHAQDIYRAAFNHAYAAHAGDPRPGGSRASHRLGGSRSAHTSRVGDVWVPREGPSDRDRAGIWSMPIHRNVIGADTAR